MKRPLSILILLMSSLLNQAQTADFTGYKVFINPGHGGHDSNDRHMITTDFWESDGNLEKGLFLRDILLNMNATVYMSRTTNNTEDDLPLSSIAEMANQANVDLFLSIHSNGFDGTQNHPLMLFRGYDDAPVFPAAKTMAGILWQKIYEKGNCWTHTYTWVKGDWSFYPEWGTQGLGVLRTLTMPGVLSEGSFHDYIPESWRLRNNDFLHHEAWAFTRALAEYVNVAPLTKGVIAGIVRDPLKTPSWYFKPGTSDESMPINGVEVTLSPGGNTYLTDDLNNGFFLFDSLDAGVYKLYFDGVDDYFKDSLTVTVTANKSVLADISLKFDTTNVPALTSLTPPLTDSIPVNQMFTFVFDLPMNQDSVEKSILFQPQVDLNFTWDEDSKILEVRPLTCFASKTDYSISVNTTACSEWEVPIEAELQFNFVTKNRARLTIERNFPVNGSAGITLYPQIRIYFDAPVNEVSAKQDILLKNSLGQTISKVREQFINAGGRGAYYFEPAAALDLNKQYQVVISPSLQDAYGELLGHDQVITFTTRSSAYLSGTTVEAFDDISHFWDPDASGSTVGTDNPLTTFTLSSDIVRSGAGSGRLDYVFVNNSGGVCRTYNTNKPSAGSDATKYFGVWVFGDLSFNTLEYWFYSSGTTNQIVSVCPVDWAGWDLKMIPFSDIGGSGERLFHSTVIRQADDGSKNGTIWFDNAVLATLTGIEDIRNDEMNLEFFPNPLIGDGTLLFTLTEQAGVSLFVYTTDGRKQQEISYGILEPGAKELHWIPRGDIPDGLYIVRLELRKVNGDLVGAATCRWVLTR